MKKKAYQYRVMKPTIEVIGRYDGEIEFFPEMQVSLETANGVIALTESGGFFRNQSFNFSWLSDSPIDVKEVTAIIVNGTHIIVP